METKILYKTDWVSLRRMIDPDNGVDGYDYLHEDRCSGQIVVILPYRTNSVGGREYLLRNEITPCWGMKSSISSITGGVERNRVIDTVLMELREEAGYEAKPSELIFLDQCHGTKSSDTMYFIYAIDLTKKEKTTDASGDGSELESKADCVWSSTIDGAVDPFVYVAYYHINKKIR